MQSVDSTPKQTSTFLYHVDDDLDEKAFQLSPTHVTLSVRRFKRRWYIVMTSFLVLVSLIIVTFYLFAFWRTSWPWYTAQHLVSQPTDEFDFSTLLNGPPSDSFRDNIKPGAKFITSWAAAGWTNDVMTYINLIYLGIISNRIAVLPPFTPSHVNLNALKPVPPIPFGDVFDVLRLRATLGVPVLEWRDIKDPGSELLEEIGCWNVWEAVQSNEHHARTSSVPNHLGLDISYTTLPDNIKLYPQYGDMHTTFWNLAKFTYPQNRNQNLSPPRPSPRGNSSLPPDEDMVCFDYLYYVCASTPFEYESDYSPAWNVVAQHLHWNPSLRLLAESYIRYSMGVAPEQSIPPFIGIHIRHSDFSNYCPSTMDATTRLTECFASLSVIAVRVEEVRAEIRELYGINVEHVIMTSDERSALWWKDVREMGWLTIDHSQTARTYGDWYPVFIDAVVHSSGLGFVGTEGSTMSVLAKRRVESWASDAWLDGSEGNGVTRMVKWGYPGADDH